MFSLNQVTITLSDLLLNATRGNPPVPIATKIETGYPKSITLYDGSVYMLHLSGIPTNTQNNEIGSDLVIGDITCAITTINNGVDSESVAIRNENADIILDILNKNRMLKDVNARIIFPKNNLLQLSPVRLEPETRTPPTAVGSVINTIIRKTGG